IRALRRCFAATGGGTERDPGPWRREGGPGFWLIRLQVLEDRALPSDGSLGFRCLDLVPRRIRFLGHHRRFVGGPVLVLWQTGQGQQESDGPVLVRRDDEHP